MSDTSIENRKPELVRLPAEDLRSNEAVQALLSDPLPTVVAMVTAALASGRQDVILGGGRLVQAILKGRTLKFFGEQLNDLLKKGKIREDYAETKYGFPSLVELMTAIDSDATDEDKLRAAKAMFVALNAPNAPESEAQLRYQLLRLVLKLTGSQLVLLGACFTLFKRRAFGTDNQRTAVQWLEVVGNLIGHRVYPLIELDEQVLAQNGIISDRTYSDRSGVLNLNTARLTELGIKLGELIETYSPDLER